MRKIHCQTCKLHTPCWVVFTDLRICDSCRLAVIEYMRATGFSLARPHVFLDEFTGVQTREKESS